MEDHTDNTAGRVVAGQFCSVDRCRLRLMAHRRAHNVVVTGSPLRFATSYRQAVGGPHKKGHDRLPTVVMEFFVTSFFEPAL